VKNVNVDALFLGPKSENEKFLKETVVDMLDEHIHWRKDFHPEDKPAVSMKGQSEKSYKDTLQRTKEVLDELSSKLRKSSMPWFSPRYLGHMNTDVLMSAAIGYIATILYNPNNCAYEGAPATTSLEIEVGQQLAGMMGYDPKIAWGHITSGGHVANFEGVWFMRNMKSIPLAVKKVKPEMVKGMNDWQLLNMRSKDILDLMQKAKDIGIFDEVRSHSTRGTGVQGGLLGKLLVPQSKHYSWTKAADILGIGQDSFINIQVTDRFRMDISHLREQIDELVAKKIPVLGVVSVVGSTEEGAVDEVHEVVKLRKEYEKKGISFYYHVDAAYGGYNRSIFLDENGKFMEYDTLKNVLHEQKVIHKDVDWPSKGIYESYKAIAEADSVTIDPHKMGYVPYSAGAFLAKDKRATDLVSYFAAYTFAKGMSNENPVLLGSYIMEGSKAGATAAAVWTANHVVPLNVTGYGRIIGRSHEAAGRFYNSIVELDTFEADNGRKYKISVLTKPDFNLVAFAFNEIGNTDLEKMNKLNLAVYDKCSYVDGPVYYDDFITSHSEFTPDSYGTAPVNFLKRLGISEKEYDRVKSVWFLRACILTPFLEHNTTYAEYWSRFLGIMRKTVAEVTQAVVVK